MQATRRGHRTAHRRAKNGERVFPSESAKKLTAPRNRAKQISGLFFGNPHPHFAPVCDLFLDEK
jgi:hypothetical protein